MEKYTAIVEKVRNEKKFSNFIFDLNTFFSNNDLLKDDFISSVVDTFDLLKHDVKFNFYG